MIAIFRREMSSYLKNVTGYVFGSFLLLFAGIYCLAYNLQSGYTNFEYAIGSMSFVFLVAVPILTMRILSEERRQKTDQLLYSLPISMTDVVLGKYSAMLVVLLIPVVILGVYPLVLSNYGNVYLPASYSALVAFFLLGAALLTIGMYISSVTGNQTVAAAICFVVMLINYFLAELTGFVSSTASASLTAFLVLELVAAVVVFLMTKNIPAAGLTAVILCAGTYVWYLADGSAFEGLFPAVLEELSLFERFYGFIDGAFDVTSVVYYLSIAAVFLYLSVQSLEKRRWSA